MRKLWQLMIEFYCGEWYLIKYQPLSRGYNITLRNVVRNSSKFGKIRVIYAIANDKCKMVMDNMNFTNLDSIYTYLL